MDNRLLRVILILIPTAIAIAIAALIFVIVVILNSDWEWVKSFPYIRETVAATSTAAMVIATLFLAWATFTVINSNRRREERDRKEQRLNEILEWAVEIGKYMLSRNLPPFAKHFTKDGNYFGEYLDDSTQDTVITKYTKFRIRSVYVAEISKDVPEIHGLVNNAIEHLRRQLRLLNRYNERYDDICARSGEEKAGLNVACNEDRLYNSAVEIIQTIGNIRSLD